ncbi:type III secretion system export apparatus subunit SctT [Caballeronia calidae]|nr:type III secretion system export apparatus subunit SctT [Caballeronia calidae]
MEIGAPLFVNYLGVLLVSCIRIFVVMFILPASSDELLTGPARNGAVFVWGTFIAVGQLELLKDMSGATLAWLCMREAIIGTIIGMSASTIFWVAQGTGVYLDDIASFNIIQLNNPLKSEQSTPISSIIMQFTISVFWCYGGMSALLGAIYESYTWWPLNSMLPVRDAMLQSFILTSADGLMLRIAKMASPVVFMLLLVDLGFGFIGRNAEKLELTNLAQPIKGIVAVVLVTLLSTMLFDQIRSELAFASFGAALSKLLH